MLNYLEAILLASARGNNRCVMEAHCVYTSFHEYGITILIPNHIQLHQVKFIPYSETVVHTFYELFFCMEHISKVAREIIPVLTSIDSRLG